MAKVTITLEDAPDDVNAAVKAKVDDGKHAVQGCVMFGFSCDPPLPSDPLDATMAQFLGAVASRKVQDLLVEVLSAGFDPSGEGGVPPVVLGTDEFDTPELAKAVNRVQQDRARAKASGTN